MYVDGAAGTTRRTPATGLPGAAGLDIAILNDHVLGPCSASRQRVAIGGSALPVERATAACDEDGGALFALAPPPLEQLTDVADRGEVMPPKTTYFDPKPYAGIFLRG